MLAPVLIPVQRWARWLARNTPGRSRRRIAAHYDLGNELFALFLDPTMMYSCAVFDAPEATLEEASLAKLERVCAKLDLRPARPRARDRHRLGRLRRSTRPQHYGCRVTTTTISARTARLRHRARARRRASQDRVTVLLEDYRDLERRRYDKLVSIEMIEAVGWQYFPTFFRRCSELLRRDGAMLLQAIVIDDRAYQVEKAGESFINTYIFPGGCLPSLEVISRSVARVTDLRQVHLEDITAHYATTLQLWRERFLDAAERVCRARLRRALPPAVGAVPELLRGRLPRAAHPGRPAAARQARLSRRAARRPREPPRASASPAGASRAAR